MRISKLRSAVLATAVAVVAMPLYAQQAPDAPKTAASSAPSQDATAPAGTSTVNAEDEAAAAAIAKANAAAAKNAAASDPGKTDSRAFMKKALAAGWHPESQRGETLYCREQVELGSRFSKKVCATQTQLAVTLEQQEFERDQLKQRGCGGNCGNSK